jgi:tripartite-type tricarboxylate transporter receptor subunit TctC
MGTTKWRVFTGANLRLLLTLWLLPSSAWSQFAELINQAKKEGEVIPYTTMTVGDFAHFGKAFGEK